MYDAQSTLVLIKMFMLPLKVYLVIYNPGWPWTCNLLPLPPVCWNEEYEPLCPVLTYILNPSKHSEMWTVWTEIPQSIKCIPESDKVKYVWYMLNRLYFKVNCTFKPVKLVGNFYLYTWLMLYFWNAVR